MACDTITIPGFTEEKNTTFDVSTKFIQLMRDSVSEDSLYIRAKDTFAVLFKDLQLNEKEKAGMVADYIAKMATDITGEAMKTALVWAKEERDGKYTLAKLKAEVEKAWADAYKTKEEVCLIQNQTAYQCAMIESTIAESIRVNGRVLTYDPKNPCKPTALYQEGLKYEQTSQVNAATYQSLADTFRKSGVVDIESNLVLNPSWTDNSANKDGTGSNPDAGGEHKYLAAAIGRRGVKGAITPIYGGYTNQQTLNAERQRIAYEDSKINHLLNSLGVVTGQMISADIDPTDVNGNSWLMDNMEDAMSRLLLKDKSTDGTIDPLPTP